MVGGQAMDMDSTGQALQLVDLENLHIHKTGALISASVELACLASEQITEAQHKKLKHYSHCVGLAFQVQDDILDIEANTEHLGKTSGKDQLQKKSTYPEILGLKESKLMAKQLIDDAIDTLSEIDQSADPLRWIATYTIEREH
jgi:geranylgeranyl pyrophosphate synthase